jgi:hypothetical protein
VDDSLVKLSTAASESSSMPETIFGVAARIRDPLPGSMRSGAVAKAEVGAGHQPGSLFKPGQHLRLGSSGKDVDSKMTVEPGRR